jgi:hypothetical protein
MLETSKRRHAIWRIDSNGFPIEALAAIFPLQSSAYHAQLEYSVTYDPRVRVQFSKNPPLGIWNMW